MNRGGNNVERDFLKDLDELTIDEEILCQGVEREFIKNVMQKSQNTR